ncbi:MAG: ion transporter [Planctomycetota bacterium]
MSVSEPYDPTTKSRLALSLRALAESSRFQAVVVGAILVAGINVGLETYPGVMQRAGGVLLAIDKAVIGFFLAEIVVRIGAHWPKPWRFFYSGWNTFDFVIVAVCLLPMGGPYAAVLRLARVLRVLRLLTAVPRLRILVTALLHAIPSIVYVAGLLMVLFYVYAVIGTVLFGRNDPVHFGTLHDSMFSLLRTVTLEDWTDLYYTQSLGSRVYPPPGLERFDRVVPRPMPILAAAYFTSFVIIGTMIVLNLFIGVVISSMTEAQAANARDALDRRAREDEASIEAQLIRMEQQMERMGEQIRGLREAVKRQQDEG